MLSFESLLECQEYLKTENRPVILCIGMFDGLHRGHQALIQQAQTRAQAHGEALTALLSFFPHPSHILRPEAPVPQIFSRTQKKLLLENLGLDLYIEHPFTTAFAATKAPDFVTLLKASIPSLKEIHVGENFVFGHKRGGDFQMLQHLCSKMNMEAFCKPCIHYDSAPISSTRIRDALKRGALEKVNAMLGFSFFTQVKLAHPANQPPYKGPFAPSLYLTFAEDQPDSLLPEAKYAVTIQKPPEEPELKALVYKSSEGTQVTLALYWLETQHLAAYHKLKAETSFWVHWHVYLGECAAFSLEHLQLNLVNDEQKALSSLLNLKRHSLL